MKSNKKGITLIALVITIIVLLILAGISISLVIGQNGVLMKAKDASNTYSMASAKEQANMRAAGYVSEYMQKVYVDNDSEAAGMTKGAYVAGQINGKEDGDYSYSVSESTITVTNKTTGQVLASGTVDDNGGITWSDSVANNSNNGNNTSNENTVSNLAKAGEIQRWDKINYDPGEGTTAGLVLPSGAKIEGEKIASLTLPSGASLEGTISASDADDWVVLDVNQVTGEVLIMPKTVSSTTLTLKVKKDGYNNAIEALDAIANIYKNPTYATSARSITVEDINKVANHIPAGEEGEYTWNNRYGMNLTTLDIIDAGEGRSPSRRYRGITFDTEEDFYFVNEYFDRNMDYWLASRYVGVHPAWVHFAIFYIADAKVQRNSIFTVFEDGSYVPDESNPIFSDGGYDHRVVPIITLKPDVELESSSKFYTQTATATDTSETQTDEYTFEHNTWSFK